MNESRVKSCLAKFYNGSYSRLQFLRAVSHPMGAHTAALLPVHIDSDDDDDDDDGDDGSYTNYDVHGATHCGRCSRRQTPPVKCVSWHRARSSRWYPADMRAFARAARTALPVSYTHLTLPTTPYV